MPLNVGTGSSRLQPNIHGAGSSQSAVPKITHAGESNELAPLPTQLKSAEHYFHPIAQGLQMQTPWQQRHIINIQSSGGHHQQGGIQNDSKSKANNMQGQKLQWKTVRESKQEVEGRENMPNYYSPSSIPNRPHYSQVSTGL
jgi:hypothetical protein